MLALKTLVGYEWVCVESGRWFSGVRISLLRKAMAVVIAVTTATVVSCAEDLKVDGRLKALRVEARVAVNRLGKTELAEKPEEKLTVARAIRGGARPSRVAMRSLRTAVRARKTKRAVAIQE